jgi:heat-inducible transcriptional repressor
VSSQAILDRCGLSVSSATIRNDLARLESYGFVTQPHTSAGRIPTTQGYRYYVDHSAPARLRSATRLQIEAFFRDVHQELSRLLKETTGLLSDISHLPAVVIGPGFGSDVVRAFHLIPLGSGVVLAVTISATGRVSQNVVRVPADYDDRERAEAESLLAATLQDRTIPEAVEQLGDLPDDLVSERVMGIVGAVARSIEGLGVNSREVYVGGTAQLAELWQDLAHVHTILGLLEKDASVRHLLEHDADGTAVRLGSEMDVSDVDLAVVSTPYDAGEHGSGRIGVLGPLRMNYRRAIKIVEEVGDNLGDSLGR